MTITKNHLYPQLPDICYKRFGTSPVSNVYWKFANRRVITNDAWIINLSGLTTRKHLIKCIRWPTRIIKKLKGIMFGSKLKSIREELKCEINNINIINDTKIDDLKNKIRLLELIIKHPDYIFRNTPFGVDTEFYMNGGYYFVEKIADHSFFAKIVPLKKKKKIPAVKRKR